MNPKTLDKILDEHKKWPQSNGEEGQKANLCGANLRGANLCEANLREADLREADLCGANLRGADLDHSAFPLWCGGLDIHIDDRQATQLLYHLIRNVKYSRNTSKAMKKLCEIKSLIKQANKFHRADECGKIEEDEDKNETN